MMLPQTPFPASSGGGAEVVAHVRLPTRASPRHFFTVHLSDGAERLLTNGCS